jgi:hypothetical protein
MPGFAQALIRCATVAALAVPALTTLPTAASAQPIGQTVWRCDGDGDSCALFRCDPYGDACRRISHWTDRDDRVRGYNYDRPAMRDVYRRECDYWNNCVTLRCDPDGDDCRVIGG